MLQLLVNGESGLAGRTKINAAITAQLRMLNNFTFYVNGDAPSDGDLNVFKTVHTAMAAILDVAGNVYTVHIKAGQYNGVPLVMPTKAVVNFVGEAAPVSAYFNFDVNFTPDATHPGQMQCQKIVFGGAFNLDATANPNCNLQFFTCGVAINQIDNNPGVTFFLFTVGLLGGTIKGKIIGEGVILVNSSLNLESGSSAEFIGLLLTDPTLNIILTGSAQLKTIGTLNKSGFPYVQGVYAAPNTPKWITDEAADAPTNGTLNVEVMGFEEITIDVTGLTDIDLSNKSGFSIVNLTSTNANETIKTISGYSGNRNFWVRPAVGLSIDWQYHAAAPGQNIYLDAPLKTTDGSQYGQIEFMPRQTAGGKGFFQTAFIDLYA